MMVSIDRSPREEIGSFCKRLFRRKFLFDEAERRILRELQRDATLSLADLSERVGLSQTPCWKRVKRLEAAGVIMRRVALLDPAELQLGATLFVGLKTQHHNATWLADFAALVSSIPEVTEFYRMSGETDYLLKIVCRDIADYDRIYRRIIEHTDLADVSASFAMEQIKYTTELPI